MLQMRMNRRDSWNEGKARKKKKKKTISKATQPKQREREKCTKAS